MNLKGKVTARYIVASLSKDAVHWLERFFDDSDLDRYYTAKRTLPKEIDDELAPYREKEPLKLYRGFHWDSAETYLGASNRFTDDIPKAGTVISYDDNMFSSWTTSPRAAWGYSTGGDGMRMVIEATIAAKDQAADTSLLPKDVLEKFKYKSGEHAESREIVVRPGKHRAKIIYVGWMDEDDEWQESEVPPIIDPEKG